MDFDVLLRGGTVIDGSGAPGVRGDIGIRGDQIAEIGYFGDASSMKTLDVSGLTVAPGFIDTHTHSDLAPLLPPSATDVKLASVRQGVTTEICGNCGFSPFPTRPEWAAYVDRHMQALFGTGARGYSSLVEYRSALAHAQFVNNLAPLVGHGTIRAGVMGFERRSATASEIDQMKDALAQAFEQGAFGLSSGLIYPPGVYADTDELIALGEMAAAYDRPYATHMRSETDQVQEAIDEALHIGETTGVPVHISHLKAAGKRNWGRSSPLLEKLDRARHRGIDVTADVYPYTAGSTMLHALLPPWVNEGGIDAMLRRIADPAIRERIDHDYNAGIAGWQDLVVAAGWDGIVIATSPGSIRYEGHSVLDVAQEHGQSPVDFVCDLLLEERASVTIIVHMMAEVDVRQFIGWTLAIIGSDGIPLPGKPHPRWAGTFARVLGKYTQDEQLLSLPEAIHKMTGLSADRFRLHDRGYLMVGKTADVVVFDPARVIDRATYEAPLVPPDGIKHVLVNGALVIEDEMDTGIRSGQFLSRLPAAASA